MHHARPLRRDHRRAASAQMERDAGVRRKVAPTESGPLGLPSATLSLPGAATAFRAELSGARATEDRFFHSRLGAGEGAPRAGSTDYRRYENGLNSRFRLICGLEMPEFTDDLPRLPLGLRTPWPGPLWPPALSLPSMLEDRHSKRPAGWRVGYNASHGIEARASSTGGPR